jgi:two-component system chemotaxis response regulator CheB
VQSAKLPQQRRIPLVLMGASMGGPGTLERILRVITPNFPGAILIAQHMPEGMTAEFASHLEQQTKIPVKEAVDGEKIEMSRCYVAPGRHNMEVCQGRGFVSLRVEMAPPSQVFVPSIDQLFRTGAEVNLARTIGIVLTGIGTDGMEGLRAIRQVGGMTLAESETSAMHFGMPKHAIDSGVVDSIQHKERLGKIILGTLLSWADEDGVPRE